MATTTTHKKAIFTLEKKNKLGTSVQPRAIVHTTITQFPDTHGYYDTEIPLEPPPSRKTRPLACKITLDHQPLSRDETFFTFLRKQFLQARIDEELSNIWPYGRVFITSSGYHGEYFEAGTLILSIIHLGSDEVTAIREMKRITEEHMYILSLQDCLY